MSDIIEVYGSLDRAYSKRTIRLLQSERSRLYLALFKSLFPDTSKPILADELWARIDECFADLLEAGYADLLPMEDGHVKPGRSVCRDLIDRYNWVESTVLPSGKTQYRLTSDATEAIEIIDRLNSSETLMGESRMRTLIEAIQQAAVQFSPDYEQGHALLEERLAAAQRELDAYERNGGGEPLTAEHARDLVANIVDLMRQLPYDLRRLEEDVHTRATDLIEDFRDDEGAVGEIIGRYIDASRALVTETDHGRSFMDSLRVLGDAGTAQDVDDKLEQIADSPAFGSGAASREQGRRLRNGWSQISRGIEQVNRENGRASRLINRAISQHDVTRDRELTSTLKALEAVAYRWAGQVSRRTQAPLAPSIQEWAVQSLQTRLYQVQQDAPPPALLDLAKDSEIPQALSIEELRRLGGPLTSELLAAICERAPMGMSRFDLAEAFNALPEAMRRPVEVAGLVQLAARLGLDPERMALSAYECVGLDGSPVTWMGPHIVVSAMQMRKAQEG